MQEYSYSYTKHIYAGTQRIASKVGDIEAFGADPRREEYAGANLKEVDFGAKYKKQTSALLARYDSLGVMNKPRELNDYVGGQSFCCGEKELVSNNQTGDNTFETPDYEHLIFFYHPDHLGSTALVTDNDGNVVQSVAYIPYGEVFIEERNGTWNTPYLFNGKELDEETGLYYYGARYLNPTNCMWLSTDPLFEKYVGMSPYNYCMGNPVKLVDPDGKAVYGRDNGDGSMSYAIIDNADVEKYGDTYNSPGNGSFKYIDDSYDCNGKTTDYTGVVVNQPKDQKYGELFTGMTDNPLNMGTAENIRYGGDATAHGESGVTSLLQVVKNFINGVVNLWRTNSGKNDENPISNNSSQNNSAKDNNEVKSDTTLHIYESVRSIRYGDGVFDIKQETDTIIERYVNGKLEKSDTIKGNKPPRF